eukprot:6173970-Pleurochrysis_carterae.AAC.1
MYPPTPRQLVHDTCNDDTCHHDACGHATCNHEKCNDATCTRLEQRLGRRARAHVEVSAGVGGRGGGVESVVGEDVDDARGRGVRREGEPERRVATRAVLANGDAVSPRPGKGWERGKAVVV